MESVAAMAMAAADAADAAAAQAPDPVASVTTLKLHMVDEEMFGRSSRVVTGTCTGTGGGRGGRGRGRGRAGKAARMGEMEGAMWSLLPSAIVECVLLKLPARSIARFKAVSRAWRQMLSSAPFLEKMAPENFLASVFDLGRNQHRHRLSCGDSSSSSSSMDRAADLDPEPSPASDEFGLPHHLLRVGEFLPPRFQHWDRSCTQVRTQRGLMCVAVQAWRPHRLCVCLLNPLNGTWRALPDLDWDAAWPDQECKAEVFLQVPDEGAEGSEGAEGVFKVFVASVCCGRFLNGHPGAATLSVYSGCKDGGASGSGSWSSVRHPCYPWPAGCDDRIRHVASGDVVYVLLLDVEQVAVLSAVDGRELRRVSLAPLRGDGGPGRDVEMSGRVQLADYGGKLVAVAFDCVGPSYSRQKPSAFSVTVWVLHGDGEGEGDGEGDGDGEGEGDGEGDGDGGEEGGRWERVTVMPGALLVYTRAATSGAAAPAPARVEVGNGKMEFFLRNLRQVQVVGDVVFVNLTAFRAQTSVVAYHLRRRVWKVVLRDAAHDRPSRVFQFLQSRPGLDLSSPQQSLFI